MTRISFTWLFKCPRSIRRKISGLSSSLLARQQFDWSVLCYFLMWGFVAALAALYLPLIFSDFRIWRQRATLLDVLLLITKSIKMFINFFLTESKVLKKCYKNWVFERGQWSFCKLQSNESSSVTSFFVVIIPIMWIHPIVSYNSLVITRSTSFFHRFCVR